MTMKLGTVVALLVLLSVSSAFAANEILDTMVPDELATDTVVDDFGVTIGAPMR